MLYDLTLLKRSMFEFVIYIYTYHYCIEQIFHWHYFTFHEVYKATVAIFMHTKAAKDC